MRKIRNKLLIVMLIISLLPALFIGSAAIWSTTKQLKSNVIKSHITRVSLIRERIERYIESVKSDLLLLKESSSLQLYLSSLNNEDSHTRRLLLVNFRNSLKLFSTQKTYYNQLVFIDSKGNEIVKIVRNKNKSKIISPSHLNNVSDTKNFKQIQKDNTNTLHTSGLILQTDIDGKLKKPIQPIIQYSIQVKNKGQQLLGILQLTLDASKIETIIKHQEVADIQLYMINKNNYYFYHKDENKRWGQNTILNNKESFNTDFPEVAKKINPNKYNFHFETPTYTVAYSQIKLLEKDNFATIISMTSNQPLFNSINNFIYVFLGIILITLIVTFIVALFLSKSLTQPIVDLTIQVEKLSKGILDKPIVTNTNDEIYTLSKSVEKLRKSVNILMRKASSH